jgi:ribosomal protein L34E
MASAKQKRKKFTRTISGKTRVRKGKKKTGKQHCSLCGRKLQGTPSGKTIAEIARLGKTKKRPSAMFAGILCGKCRTRIIDEAIMARQKSKNIEQAEITEQKFIKQALGMMK